MKSRLLPAFLLTIALATLLFYVFVHQVSTALVDLALRPEVRAALERNLDDLKQLSRKDPERRDEYRRRFEDNRRLLARLDVIRMSREAMLRRIEVALMTVFALAIAAAATIWAVRQRRAEARERSEYLERLKGWQETSRRHAHEIKTPLTAARLELERLASLARRDAPHEEIVRASESVVEEFTRLARFTTEFSSFAALGAPVQRPEAIEKVIREFCEVFADAWPNLELKMDGKENASSIVSADRDLVRQVFVNLCTNSARATSAKGVVTFSVRRDGDEVHVDVRDTGSGIADSVRPRIFEPYVTTRRVGEGMGLGLAISRKILLDHGGDLELVDTSARGTTFRLKLPVSS